VLSVGGRLEDTSGSDDAYWRLLARLWTGDMTLVVIENDMLPTPAQVQGLLACHEPWCAHPYQLPGGVMPALGLAKFSRDLQRACPDLLRAVGEMTGDGVPPRHWVHLDVRVDRALRGRGVELHLHPGSVRHLRRPLPVLQGSTPMAYRYRWDSPHTTPDEVSGVGPVMSGQEFESDEPVIHPYAVLLEGRKSKGDKPAEPQE